MYQSSTVQCTLLKTQSSKYTAEGAFIAVLLSPASAVMAIASDMTTMACHSQELKLRPKAMQTKVLQHLSSNNCLPFVFSERLNHQGLGCLILTVTWKLEP